MDKRLVDLVDILIPASPHRPAASETGALAHVMATVEGTAIAAILSALAPSESGAHPPATRGHTLQDRAHAAEKSHPLEFAAIVRATYEGYYGDPGVVATLGLEATPQPNGYSLREFDPASVAAVRSRGSVYRHTDS